MKKVLREGREGGDRGVGKKKMKGLEEGGGV